jgi:hypothetical protein
MERCWSRRKSNAFRILLHASSPPGTSAGLYVTDGNGTIPKMIMADARGRVGASPDGQSILAIQNGKRVVHSTAGSESKEMLPLLQGQFPISWASDGQHMFTQELTATGVNPYKVDLQTGRSELWQSIKPKDQIGLRAMANSVAITHDGRWLAYQYGSQVGLTLCQRFVEVAR